MTTLLIGAATVLLTWMTACLSAAAADSKPLSDELSCLARAIYFEARGEPEAGQMAVGRVIINRAASGHYPATVCGVVFQNVHRRLRCQFTFACDGKPDVIRDTDSWGAILYRASVLLATERECTPRTASFGPIAVSTHYHASYANPRWSKSLRKTGVIGRHIFFIEERAAKTQIASAPAPQLNARTAMVVPPAGDETELR